LKEPPLPEITRLCHLLEAGIHFTVLSEHPAKWPLSFNM